MCQCPSTADGPSKDEIYRCLANHRRRRLLDVLADRSEPVAVDELATRLLEEDRAAARDEPASDRRSALVDLRHVQLPALDDAGLVEWDRDEGTVSLATDVLADPAFEPHFEHLDASWDPIVEALAHRYRRVVLSIAASRRTSIDRARLAELVAERVGERSPDATDRIAVELVHRHLPILEDAGVLAYDRDDGTVLFRGHPDLDDGWFHSDRPSPDEIVPALIRTYGL